MIIQTENTDKSLFKVSKTYSKVTPESCELGDYSETGFEWEETSYNLQDLLHEVRDIGIASISHYDGHCTVYGYDFTSNYKTGESCQYALHIDCSERVLKRLLKILEKKGK